MGRPICHSARFGRSPSFLGLRCCRRWTRSGRRAGGMADQLGSRYVLGELVGRGSTGIVRLAHTRDDGHTFAAKLLRSEIAEDPGLVLRFLQERALIVNVEHANLVRVYDLVAEGSRFAIIMEYIAGGDLRRHLLQR